MYFQYDCNILRIVKPAHGDVIVERNTIRGQGGNVLVFVTLILATIFGFAALAIDVGYLFVVRNELQNAADSAALAGASYLYGDLYKTSKVSCAQSNPTFPNWACAQSNASAAITLNKAASAQLTDGQIQYGYWNITGNPLGLQSTSTILKPYDFPAVKVTISKSSGQNGGGVASVFARVLGINSLDASATAVAVVEVSPKLGYTTKSLFPVAITKCMFDKYWDSSTNQPTTNPPTTFPIDSSYHSPLGGCQALSWSPLNNSSPSNSLIRTLIDYASGKTNPTPHQFTIGDSIYIDPGTRASDYKDTNDCSRSGNKTCEYVVFPVVCFNSTSNCDTLPTSGGLQLTPIVAFACIHILSAEQGAKTIKAQMVSMSDSGCKVSGGGTGPAYGAYLPPKLANYSGNTY